MHLQSLLAMSLALFVGGPAEPAREQTFLASIVGIDLGPDEYVAQFRINTWGVDIVAVCRIPAGWQIRAGRTAAPDGVIAGEASHGVTFIDAPRLGELEDLVIIRTRGRIEREARGNEPPTFSGRAVIGTYGGEAEAPARELSLSASNVRLHPASACSSPAG